MLTFRDATADQAGLISHIYATSWRKTYRGHIAQHYLDRLPDEYWVPSIRSWLSSGQLYGLMVYDDDKPVGCCIYGRGRDEDYGDWCEIVSLYLLPDTMRQGIGGKLLEDPENRAHYLRLERKPDFDAAALGVYTLENGHIRRITGAANGISEYLCVYDCQNSSTVDILDPRITDAFLALTHEKYFERFGAEFGKGIAGFFTDEPRLSEGPIPWSPILPDEFKARYGYDILPVLPALYLPYGDYRAVRHDFWALVSDLFVHAYMEQIFHWCEAHNCRLTGHMMMEESLYSR